MSPLIKTETVSIYQQNCNTKNSSIQKDKGRLENMHVKTTNCLNNWNKWTTLGYRPFSSIISIMKPGQLE